MWSWLTGRHDEVKGIKVTHIKAIDSEGSLVIYSEGSSGKKVAALKGTTIYELGMRLSAIVDCDKSISEKAVTIIHPESMFYFTSQYDMDEANHLIRQEEEERRRRNPRAKKSASKSEKGMHVPTTADPLDPEAGILSLEDSGEPSAESEGDLATINPSPSVAEEGDEHEDIPFSIEELKHLDDIDRAAHQHLVCRVVSGYPVVSMKPFVNEFYSRFVEQGSPYVIFEEDVYSVYRLWMNTGLAQASLCRALVKFLKSKPQQEDRWSVETMESFLVCNLYNDYEAIFPHLESDLSLTKWGQNYIAPEGIVENRVTRTYSRILRRSRIYALKEVQRLWIYNQSKKVLLERVFNVVEGNESRTCEEGISGISGIPDGESQIVAPDIRGIALKKGKEKATENGTCYSKSISEETFASSRALEQRILKEAIEAQIAASSVHTECWEKVMDPIRKLIVEVRDICNQVCINQVRQERPDESVDFDTNLLRFKAGVVETVAGDRPHHTEGGSAETSVPSSDVAYDPDVPHLPTPTLDRLLMYLNTIDDCMLKAVRNQDPQRLRKDPNYYSPFQGITNRKPETPENLDVTLYPPTNLGDGEGHYDE
jgi:hypothetical protein